MSEHSIKIGFALWQMSLIFGVFFTFISKDSFLIWAGGFNVGIGIMVLGKHYFDWELEKIKKKKKVEGF